jgi:predicted permease
MSATLSGVIGSVLPILFLIALGMLLRRTRVLGDAGVAGLKQLIVSVSLPAVLFTTFLNTRFEPQHLWVVLTNNVLSVYSLVSVAVFVAYVL